MIGSVLETLKAVGADRNTLIVFTSDHGDMLGERSMWFKKHFFEPSLRVPLFVYAPWIQSQRVQEHASLVDLLPTFASAASDSNWEDSVDPLAGTNLLTLLDRGNPAPTRAVYAEYLAEAALAPIFMIQRGTFKYICSTADPTLMFDVATDPDELVNLAGDATHAERLAAFAEEANTVWDAEQIHRDILKSQRRRRLVRAAHAQGTEVRWNHGEQPGETVPWYRGDAGYSEWAFDYMPRKTRS